jgi:hypothetical protein
MPRLNALVIGSARYDHGGDLKNPTNDADDMAKVLISDDARSIWIDIGARAVVAAEVEHHDPQEETDMRRRDPDPGRRTHDIYDFG